MICAFQRPDEWGRAREAGVRSPERDGLPCQTQILDQERGEGSLGRTGGLYRGQSGRGRRGEIKETSGESERKREVSGEETWQRGGVHLDEERRINNAEQWASWRRKRQKHVLRARQLYFPSSFKFIKHIKKNTQVGFPAYLQL